MGYGQGTVNVDMKVNGKSIRNHLSEVWHVPDVSRNLFSVSQTLAKGFVFRAEGNECSFTRDGHVLLRGITTVNGLYALKMRVVCPEVPAEVFGTKCFVHVPKQRRQKLDPKSVAGFFVGYFGEKDGYRVWLKEQNKIILNRDVIFKNEASCSAQNGKSCSVVNKPSVGHGSGIELIRSFDVLDSDVCQEIEEASCDAIDSRESPDEQERNLRTG
ncbi:hypothetical protein AVEN_9640-1 [Araneus ventricosus]|uniref:Retrovirus-related Pol polyprotein from transposon TNT 1-94 n=1 Tax=Araneus ventricosus TaxID=182803 RepID=A0A4Y2EXS8_ARAVE|nr:hypothetical protein AVEN_9640-1 [Araneus ventricosus]